jgi:hypothetical protein
MRSILKLDQPWLHDEELQIGMAKEYCQRRLENFTKGLFKIFPGKSSINFRKNCSGSI